MAEFRNPIHENGSGARASLILIIILACLFGLQWFTTNSRTSSALPYLKKISVDATKTVSPAAPGSMNILERGLFVALAFTQAHVVAGWSGSWGWAIISLTVAINLLMLPLRIAGVRSGARMQRIQPEIESIKARYKSVKLADPRHNDMTAEIAKLQRDHGVNPFGGCLLLLIQMPLLFAFFGMLRKAAALHGADWLWLHDLSSPDPYHVLPVLMVVFQALVQWYTPSPGSDPAQQKLVMLVMTVTFGYVSWHYASGLALYALTGSLFSLATQVAMNMHRP